MRFHVDVIWPSPRIQNIMTMIMTTTTMMMMMKWKMIIEMETTCIGFMMGTIMTTMEHRRRGVW